MTERTEVLANPFKRMLCRNDKDALDTVELHLGNLGITTLNGFDKFPSLEILWLNDNELSNIEGLDANFRVKTLYLHGNKILALQEDCFSPFLFLSKLTLNDNKLVSIEATLDELKKLSYLKHLDLYNNPIEQEDNYRLRVIGELRYLDILDRHVITAEERVQARLLKAKLAKMGNFLNQSAKKKLTKEEEEAKAMHDKLLQSAKKKVTKTVNQLRIFIEGLFVVIDKRESGFIATNEFWAIMRENGLSQVLDEEERQAIEKEYSGTFKIDGISQTGTINTTGINYRKFCRQNLPKEMRSHVDDYKFEPVPEISICTQDLTRFVDKINSKKRLEEEFQRKKMLAANKTAPSFGTTGNRTYNICEKHGLSPWISKEIHNILNGIETQVLNAQDIDKLFRSITVFGKIPELGISATRDRLLNNEETVSLEVVRESLGCSVYSKAGKTQSTSSAGSIVVKFRDLAPSESLKLGTKMFDEATLSLESLLRANASTDIKPIVAQTVLSAINGTRLIASTPKPALEGGHLLPHEVLKAASERADILVIPNLHPEPKLTNGSQMEAWAKELSLLGLKGDVLSLALDRKQKSLLTSGELPSGPTTQRPSSTNPSLFSDKGGNAMSRNTSASSLSSVKSTVPKASKLSSSGKQALESTSAKVWVSSIPPVDPNPVKGWNATTGTIVFN